MAWNAGDRDNIMAFLGYSTTQQHLGLVQGKMDTVQELSADSVTRVQGYLTELTQLESQIETARIAVGGAMGQLKGESRRFVNWISITLNLDVYKDIF